MFFNHYLPKILDMRISSIDKCFAAMLPHILKAAIRVAVTRDDVITLSQVVQNPVIKPWKQSKSKCFSVIWSHGSCGSVSQQTDSRIQQGPFRGHTGCSSSSTKSQET